jgi:transcriptional regulator with XRE-family HTH domain
MGRPIEKWNKLGEWVVANGWTRQRLADALGITRASVDRFCNGLRRPSLEMAFQIEDLTEGAVPARYWIEVSAHSED